MYSRQEASQLRQSFWTTFGQYMAPLPSADGRKINWINYKTGVPHISFRMEADNKVATIAITISHPDAGIRQLFFEQFVELRKMLHDILAEEWQWVPLTSDLHGKQESKIYTQLTGVNIFNKEDWPALISFFKARLISLDAFWETARPAFDSLS